MSEQRLLVASEDQCDHAQSGPALASVVAFALLLADTSPATAQPATDASGLAETRAQIAAAIEVFNEGGYRQAVRELEEVIESDDFTRLPSGDQRNALSNSGWIRLLLDQDQEAHREFVTLTSMAIATGDDWMGRMTSAYRLGNFADASESLVEIAARFPSTFDQIASEDVQTLLTELENSPDQTEPYLLLMDALVSAAWRTTEPGDSSIWHWKYTLAMLERGMLDKAIRAVELIRFTPVLISMRIDRRFDAVVSARPDLFDIDRAIQSEIDAWRQNAADAPSSAEAVYHLSVALMRADRPGDSIDLISQALLRDEQRPNDPSPWSDMERYRVWLLNRRSDSYWLLGMFDESVADLQLAIEMDERGRRGGGQSVSEPLEYIGDGRRYFGEPLESIRGRRQNVSQSIDLARRYALLGRVGEARRLLLDAGPVSEYGEMVKRFINVLIAVYEGNERAIGRELRFMRINEDDARPLVQSALILAEDTGGALELLQRRLSDPDERQYALLGAQDYAGSDETLTEFGRRLRSRERDFYRMDAVRSAISTYGRIESFDVRPHEVHW